MKTVGVEPPDQRGESGALIRRGAELVHLSEQLHVRMFALALLFLGAAGAFSVPLAEANSLEGARPLTILFSALAILAAAWGLARRRRLYLWLRRGRVRQLAPGLVAAAIVLADGPYSPCWWIASALLLGAAVVGDRRSTHAAGGLAAAAYVAGTLLRGASLLPAGNSEYIAVTASLLINPPIAHALIESFARFVLRLHRLEGEVAAAARPAPAAALMAATQQPAGAVTPAVIANPADAKERAAEVQMQHRRQSLPHRDGTSRLTARQLEVTLLARDGLRQAEIAKALGISSRQVERHLEEARRRSGAATTAQLIAMLISQQLAPAPSTHAVDDANLADGQPTLSGA